jgi:hypothetical protein
VHALQTGALISFASKANSSFSSLNRSKQCFLLEFVDLLGVMFTGERRRIVVREREEGVWLVKKEWRRRGWRVLGDGVLRQERINILDFDGFDVLLV